MPSRSRRAPGRAGRVLARLRSRIEGAPPAPWGLVVRDARSHRDGADMDVAEIDQPAFFTSVVVAAAGEGGHNPLKRELGEQAIVLKRRRG